jgi:hypothetical protein
MLAGENLARCNGARPRTEGVVHRMGKNMDIAPRQSFTVHQIFRHDHHMLNRSVASFMFALLRKVSPGAGHFLLRETCDSIPLARNVNKADVL